MKTLKPGSSEDEKVKFLQEAAINGQFKHPHVVQLLGVVIAGEPVSGLIAKVKSPNGVKIYYLVQSGYDYIRAAD